MPKKKNTGFKKDRYWEVEIDSGAFSEFDAYYKVIAPDEESAKKEALDRFEGRDRRNVVSSLAMTDYAAELMEINGWYGDEGEAAAWEDVTQGWSEPCGDNRWIRGEMYVGEVNLDEDFHYWCKSNGYFLSRNGRVTDHDSEAVMYCPHCDYIVFGEYCWSCGYETLPIDRDFLFDRYMSHVWSD